MSEIGLFCMDRGWFKHPIFAREPFTEREAWAWMIAAAARHDGARGVGTVRVPLHRGELAASIRYMGTRWQWRPARVQRFLARLAVEMMIVLSNDTGVTKVTIRNYDKYQVTEFVAESPVTESPVTESANDTAVSQQQSSATRCADNRISDPRAGPESASDTASDTTKERNKPPSSEVGGDAGNARVREPPISQQAHDLAGDVMQILGIDREFVPPGWCGFPMWLQAGLSSGWRPEIVRVAAARICARKNYQPPFSFRYLLAPVKREHELMAEPHLPMPPVVVSTQDNAHGQTAANQPATDWQSSRDAFRRTFANLKAHNAKRSESDRSGASSGEIVQLIAAPRRG